MYCPKCGAPNADNVEKCTSCGYDFNPIVQASQQEPVSAPDYPVYNNGPAANSSNVPNHLVWSIIVTVISVFLCNVLALPAGIVAIVFSTQVDSKLRTGDYDGAARSSKNSKIWCWVATGLEILSVIIGILFIILMIIGVAEYNM